MPGFGDPTFFRHGFNNGFVKGHRHFGGAFFNGVPAFYYPYYPLFGYDSSYYQPEQPEYSTPNVVYVPVPDPNLYRQTEPQATAPAPPPERAKPVPDAPPDKGDPTVLVFRDGHTKEVSNYAIMGQTLWVFSGRTAKIALADLDIPATRQANEDRGISFRIPESMAPKTP
jgi:hypothetical protein